MFHQDKKLTGKIKVKLRQLFLQSEYRNVVIRRCRVDRGKYKCELCGNIFSMKDINVHHTIPIHLSEDWNEYIELLFCSPEHLLAICKSCHEKEHV